MIDNKQQMPKRETTLANKVRKARGRRTILNRIDKLDKEIVNDEKKLQKKKLRLESLLKQLDEIEVN